MSLFTTEPDNGTVCFHPGDDRGDGGRCFHPGDDRVPGASVSPCFHPGDEDSAEPVSPCFHPGGVCFHPGDDAGPVLGVNMCFHAGDDLADDLHLALTGIDERQLALLADRRP
jgi:hypothetical protein